LWKSIYTIDNSSIKAYSMASMVLYIFIVNTVFEMVNTSSISSKVSNDIRLGTLSNYLLRPMSYLLYQFADTCGAKLAKLPMILVLNGIFGAFFCVTYNIMGETGFAITGESVLFFTVFILLSFLWNYLFDYLLGVIGVWMDNPWILFYLKRQILPLVCGLLIPIDLFPNVIKNVLEALPFQFYVYFPYKVLIGSVSLQQCINNLLLFAAWIVGIGVFTQIVWKKSLKKYTAVGG
jgi:ABC-2 type transport system permease protein